MVRAKSNSGEFEIYLDLLKTFLLDGEYTVDMDPSLRFFEFDTIPVGTIKWNFALELCHRTIGRWDTMWYDPSFSALFVGNLDQVTPSESKKTAICKCRSCHYCRFGHYCNQISYHQKCSKTVPQA